MVMDHVSSEMITDLQLLKEDDSFYTNGNPETYVAWTWKSWWKQKHL